MAVQAIVVCSSRTGGRVLPPYASAALLLVGLAVLVPMFPLSSATTPFADSSWLRPTPWQSRTSPPTTATWPSQDVAGPGRSARRNGDGTRDLSGGQPFAPGLLTGSQFSPKTAELFMEYLREVSVQVRITSLDGASADAATTRGNYDWRSRLRRHGWGPGHPRSGSGCRRGFRPSRSAAPSALSSRTWRLARLPSLIRPAARRPCSRYSASWPRTRR